jgi:hypothetical protein
MSDETILGKLGKGHKMGIGLLAYWLIGLLAYWLIGLLAYCGLLFLYFIVSTRTLTIRNSTIFLRIWLKKKRKKNYNQFIYSENCLL